MNWITVTKTGHINHICILCNWNRRKLCYMWITVLPQRQHIQLRNISLVMLVTYLPALFSVVKCEEGISRRYYVRDLIIGIFLEFSNPNFSNVQRSTGFRSWTNPSPTLGCSSSSINHLSNDLHWAKNTHIGTFHLPEQPELTYK
jgi:hypothetical protein